MQEVSGGVVSGGDAHATNDTTPASISGRANREDAGPTIPDVTEEQAISAALRALAQSGASPIAKELKLKRIAKEFGLGDKVVRQAFQQAERDAAQQDAPALPEATTEEQEERKRQEQIELAWQRQAMRLLAASDLFSEFSHDLRRRGYVADNVLAKSLLISHGARLLSDSTAFMLAGPSGSGKSDAAIKGSEFLPPEMVKSITSTSPQALYYLGDIKHKYLVFGEMHPVRESEDDYRQIAMRQLISENRVTRQTVEQVDGEYQAVEKVTEGPCVIVATSTTEQSQWNDEFANRLSWIQTKDDPSTTARVLEAQALSAEQPWRSDSAESITARWHRYHRLLRQRQVRIGFAAHIKPSFPHVTARRLFKLVIIYIQVSALLHQGSRATITKNGIEYLEATLADYDVAYELLTSNAPRVLEICSKPARAAYEQIRNHFSDGQRKLTTGKIQSILNQPGATVRRWLKQLADAGLLIADKAGRQNEYSLGDPISSEQDLGLVPPTVLANIFTKDGVSSVEIDPSAAGE